MGCKVREEYAARNELNAAHGGPTIPGCCITRLLRPYNKNCLTALTSLTHPQEENGMWGQGGWIGRGQRSYLCIHGRVPIRVVEDDCVSSSQVHAYAAAASGQDEDKNLGIAVEALHQDLHTHPHSSPKNLLHKGGSVS